MNQGNQTRAFKYDAEGKLLFERIPEMTATINDGTGVYWTTKYTHTTWFGTKEGSGLTLWTFASFADFRQRAAAP